MSSLEGLGFVAIWNGIPPEHDADFRDWHQREHMPERLSIPGFRTGTRWRADRVEPSYFTLYVIESPSVAHSAPYLERLNAPTEWTRRIMVQFTKNARCVGEFGWSSGEPTSSRVAVAQFHNKDGGTAAWLGDQIMAISGVVGCHIGWSDTAASSIATLERKGRAVAEPAGMIVATLDSGVDAEVATKRLGAVLPDSLARDFIFYTRDLVMP